MSLKILPSLFAMQTYFPHFYLSFSKKKRKVIFFTIPKSIRILNGLASASAAKRIFQRRPMPMPTPTPTPATRFRENLGSDSFHAILSLVRRRRRAQLHSAHVQATATEVREENGGRLVLDNLQGCLIKTLKI